MGGGLIDHSFFVENSGEFNVNVDSLGIPCVCMDIVVISWINILGEVQHALLLED